VRVAEQPPLDLGNEIAAPWVTKLAFDLGQPVGLRLENREVRRRIGNGEAIIDEGLAKAPVLEACQSGGIFRPRSADDRVHSLR